MKSQRQSFKNSAPKCLFTLKVADRYNKRHLTTMKRKDEDGDDDGDDDDENDYDDDDDDDDVVDDDTGAINIPFKPLTI